MGGFDVHARESLECQKSLSESSLEAEVIINKLRCCLQINSVAKLNFK